MEARASFQTVETNGYDRRQRLYDDVTTWTAEILDGAMRTPVEYAFDGRELYGRDGSALEPIFASAIAQAEKMVADSPNLGFELRRRRLERAEYDDMIGMSLGRLPNTMIVVSDFPPELMRAMRDLGGYNVKRKQTMLRVITRLGNGNLLMRTQTLDGSDRTALEAIYTELGFAARPGELLGQRMLVELAEVDQMFVVDRLMGVYDRSLGALYGGDWHAGRQRGVCIDTYGFVCSQKDLLAAFMERESAIGINQELLYNLAAALQARYELALRGENNPAELATPRAYLEMLRSGRSARANRQAFSGCGMSIGSGEFSTEDDLSGAGYGNKIKDGEVYEFKPDYCRKCDPESKKEKVPCGPCRICCLCDPAGYKRWLAAKGRVK